jgi:hypothetical protein
MYRCEVSSLSGLIQQLAVQYVSRGYWYYVTRKLPPGTDWRSVDAKLIEKYRIDLSPSQRSRRKLAGLSNVHYVRFEDFFVLLASEPRGKHRFFAEESGIHDVRDVPLKFGGYSIGYKNGHASVRIEQEGFNDLKAYLLDNAVHRSRESMERAFSRLDFVPYAPVRSQLCLLLRKVNEARAARGFEPLSKSCLRLHRRPVKVFSASTPTLPLLQEEKSRF